MLGEGRVFALAEGIIRETAFKLPEHWPRLVGCDFGFDHPAAAVWLVWDRDSDTVYVTDAQKSSGLNMNVTMLLSGGRPVAANQVWSRPMYTEATVHSSPSMVLTWA